MKKSRVSILLFLAFIAFIIIVIVSIFIKNDDVIKVKDDVRSDNVVNDYFDSYTFKKTFNGKTANITLKYYKCFRNHIKVNKKVFYLF